MVFSPAILWPNPYWRLPEPRKTNLNAYGVLIVPKVIDIPTKKVKRSVKVFTSGSGGYRIIRYESEEADWEKLKVKQ